jgi:hypothetical protein
MILDCDLLRRYADTHSEDAFAELVRRHINLVYSAAMRQVSMGYKDSVNREWRKLVCARAWGG